MVNALIHRYGASGLCDVQGESDRLGIVHRLDGDTSGLMLAARTDLAGRLLMEAIGRKDVDRRYLALVHGVVAPETGLVDAPIERCPSDRTRMSVGDGPSSRDAMTTFTVLDRFEGCGASDGYTLLECKLYTGRTHRIRVHMQYIKHPIVGDATYNAHGPKDARSQLGLSRQFLHSYKLGFAHPVTNEEMSFSDGLPDDLCEGPRLYIGQEGVTKMAKKVLLGVTGCIAAYKACEVLRGLQKEGCETEVVMTENATRFVSAHTFSALSGRPPRARRQLRRRRRPDPPYKDGRTMRRLPCRPVHGERDGEDRRRAWRTTF